MALWIICLLASVAYAVYSCASLGTAAAAQPRKPVEVPVHTAAPTMTTRAQMRRPKTNHVIDDEDDA